MAARLISESLDTGYERFLFAFDITENARIFPSYDDEDDDDTPLRLQIGFIYIKEDGEEERYANNALASILSHSPYWNEPTTEFPPEEIERIVNLHPLNDWGKPMTPEELELNRQMFPY
ncbi:hypothetical protein [uncultured Fretibacterium sp.]|uniref:hypothetical protein n=1 Tax=uncultured Fretibacterium sp. TaxID=1678694 RepID=UPI00263526BD|nr:hypothetical protein [uncultured Fretibacterium sp.]